MEIFSSQGINILQMIYYTLLIIGLAFMHTKGLLKVLERTSLTTANACADLLRDSVNSEAQHADHRLEIERIHNKIAENEQQFKNAMARVFDELKTLNIRTDRILELMAQRKDT